MTKQAKTNWERFFDGHAPVYDDNIFTKNTAREIPFIVKELGLRPGRKILDIGCGTGRHSVELATRGFAVTGLDLSSGMLAQARARAKAAGVQVRWLRRDAARFSFPRRFDAAICLCEGSFGLLGLGQDPIAQPLAILRNIARSLKPGAKALFTVLNGARLLRMHSDQDVAKGRFDPLTLVESSRFPPRKGLPALALRERGFLPTELVLLFRMADLQVLHIGGGTAGDWGRRTLKLDEFEIMVLARKSPAA
ncbi:MAG: class I SAM-dependent methyltransferase [Elusimicrobia bacterium]|nr:class I SAM-dependent methyltransferase [Elusimicrobiota bacterium]